MNTTSTSLSGITIILPERTFHHRRVIDDCEWKLQTFLERDAYARYDYEQAMNPPPDDRLLLRHRQAMNAAMRARSSEAAWSAFLDQPVPELSAVPRDLCLVDGDDVAVQRAVRAVANAVGRMGSVRYLTDMAVTKMLFLLRPWFIPISDSYVRTCLGLRDGTVPDAGPGRATFARERVTAVMRAVRQLGQDNRDSLCHLERFVARLSPITVASDCQEATRAFRGRQIPAVLSLVRMLDILMWADVALSGPQPDPYWARWYAARQTRTE